MGCCYKKELEIAQLVGSLLVIITSNARKHSANIKYIFYKLLN